MTLWRRVRVASVRAEETPMNLTYGVRRDEVAWPERPIPRHLASGSGWERSRGGGRVPARNPWKEDPHVPNPAQDGSRLDRTGGR